MREPVWPGPSVDEEEEEAVAPAASEARGRQWLWAWVVVGLYVVLRFPSSPPDETMAYRLGHSVGGAILPLLVAYFLSRFWQHRQAPGVGAAVVVVLSMAAAGKTAGEVATVTKAYVADVKERISAWDARCAENAKWGPEQLANREELTACIESYGETDALTARLLAEFETGDVYRDRLHAAKVAAKAVDDAWARLRRTDDFVHLAKVLQLSKEVMMHTKVYLATLDMTFGKWELAEDGTIEFGEGVEGRTVGRFNEIVDELDAAINALGEQVDKR